MNDFGIIFDLDGTLIDSEGQIHRLLNKTLTSFKLNIVELEFIQDNLGIPLESILKKANIEELQIPNVIKDFRNILNYEIINGSNALYPGVYEHCIKLYNQNVPMAIATNKPIDLAKKVITNSPLNNIIRVIEGTGSNRPKPFGDTLQACASQLKCSRYVMVGDSQDDMTVGLDFGAICVGIYRKFKFKNLLLSSGADFVFDSFESLALNWDEIIKSALS